MKRKASSIAIMKRKATRRVDVDGSTSASLDKISELPQVLLQNIQYFLSPKQAAQTILLSKAWQNTWSSNNRPNIDLDEDSFLGTSDEFLSLVHNTLQGYHDHKLRINAFRLGLSELNSESVSLLEEWIPVVIHMGVKMFHLHITDTTSDTYYYNLPRAVFEAESIIELSLHGCRLDYDDDKVIMFKHLKVLKLSQVYIEEKTFQRIISSCPLIEDMELLECEGLRSITLNNLQNLKEFYFMCYDCLRIEGGEEEGDICPTIEWVGVANLKSITICGHANWFHSDNFQVFPNLKDLSLINVCLSGISSLCDDFWCYFPGLENLKFNNCYGLEEIQISSHSIQHISLTDINRSIKARFDAPNILSFEYSGKYIPATLSFAKSYSKWKSDIVLELDIVDDNSLWLKQLKEILRGGLSQSKITLDLYKLPNHQQNNNNNIFHSFEPVEVEELKFFFQKKQKNSSTTVVMNDLFRVCRPKNVDVCWHAKEDGKYERKSNEYAEEVFKILMERSQSISTEIINQDYNSPSPFTQLIWQNDLKEVSLKIYDDILHEWRPPLHVGTSLCKCALPDNGYLHEIRFQLKWRRKAGPKPGDVTAKQLFRKKLLISDIGSEPHLLQGPKLEDVTAKQLFRKKLRISDIGPSSNRLYLDVDGDQSLMEFFTEDEKLRLEDGIKVTGLDIVGDKRCYDLRLCSKPGLTMYAGIGEMLFRNNLIKDNIVEIWGSRKDSNLRMVLCFGRYFPRAVIEFFLD